MQLSTSKKSKDGLKYDTDFTGFCNLVGHAHNKAADLKEGDKIKIGDFEVTNSFNKEKKITYTNIAIFEYEVPGATTTPTPQTPPPNNKKYQDEDSDPDSMPF